MAALGIDIGTASWRVALTRNEQRAEILADADGHRTLSAIVGYYPDQEPLVGFEAMRRHARFPLTTLVDLKSFLGLSFEEVTQLKKDRALNRLGFPFKIVAAKKGQIEFEITTEDKDDKIPLDLHLAKLFTKLGEVVISLPHDLITSTAARETLLTAFAIAFPTYPTVNVSFMSDPLAVCLAYELDAPTVTQNALVVDFGTSLSLTLVAIRNGVFTVLASHTSPAVTSRAFDNMLVDHFAKEFMRKSGSDVRENRRSLIKLLHEIDRIKRVLSQNPETRVSVEALSDGVDFNSQISRARFDDLTDPVLRSLQSFIQTSLPVGLAIDRVIVSGGHGRVPRLLSILQNIFPTTPVMSSIDTTEVIALGAAKQADILSRRMAVITQKRHVATLAQSLGLRGPDNKGTAVPCSNTTSFAVSPNQKQALVSLLEGSNIEADKNKLIAETAFSVEGATTASLTIAVEANAEIVLRLKAGSAVSTVHCKQLAHSSQ